MFRKSDWTDQKIEVVIANLLRAGVTVAATVVVVGGLIFLVRHGMAQTHYRAFSGEPSDLRQWKGILRSASTFHGRGIIQLGILFLIATPVARVAFSAFAFALERDWLYVGVASAVLSVLMYSLLGAAL
jgi:uncharacterized membrane protein